MATASLKNSLLNVWKNDKPLCVVWLGVAVYTIFFTTLSFIRYDSFSYNDFDFALYIHETWKIAHGSAENSIFMDTPIWGIYLALISYLIAPFFALFNYNPKFLLILQALMLGLGAVPVYLIARSRITAIPAVLLAFTYLCYPPVWFTNLCEYYPKTFSTVGLLYMFYFMERQQYRKFMIFLVLVLLLRVDMGLTTFMFGIYALLDRKPWKWVIAPSLISAIWVIVGLFIIIPHYQGHMNMAKVTYYNLGKSFPDVLCNIVTKPNIILNQLFSFSRFEFLLQIILPFIFLPFLALREFCLAFPSLLQHMLSARTPEHSIFFHYTCTITPFVLVSTIYAVEKYFKLKSAKLIICTLILLMNITSNIYYACFTDGQMYWQNIFSTDDDLYKQKMVEQIPAKANVISSFEFSPRLAGREKYYSMHYIYSGRFYDGSQYKIPKDLNFALINFNDSRMLSFLDTKTDVRLRRFFDDGWNLLDSVNNVCLFERRWPVTNPPYVVKNKQYVDKSLMIANFSDVLGLTRFDIKVRKDNNFRILDLTYSLYVFKQVPKNLKMMVKMVDANGKLILFDFRNLCYGIYPSSKWGLNEEISESFGLIIPNNIAAGKYKIVMALYDSQSLKILPIGSVELKETLHKVWNSDWFGI